MYCANCGARNSDDDKACFMCGESLRSIKIMKNDQSDSSGSSQAFSQQPQIWPQTPPPQAYAVAYNPAPIYRSVKDVPVTSMFKASLIFAVLTFIGFFLPWITVKWDFGGGEDRDYVALYEEFEDRSSFKTGGAKSKAEKDDYNGFDNDEKYAEGTEAFMFYSALFGYLFLIASAITMAAARRYVRGFGIFAVIGFIASIIADYSCVLQYRDMFNRMFGKYLDGDYEFSIGVGIGPWVVVVFAFISGQLAYYDLKRRKKAFAYYRKTGKIAPVI